MRNQVDIRLFEHQPEQRPAWRDPSEFAAVIHVWSSGMAVVSSGPRSIGVISSNASLDCVAQRVGVGVDWPSYIDDRQQQAACASGSGA